MIMRRLVRAADRGFTFVEMLVVVALVSILASAVVPLAKVTMQRQREIELRRALRELRTAIDHYKDAVDGGQIPASRVRAAKGIRQTSRPSWPASKRQGRGRPSAS
jgi:prepilin-type N-terminal cleavage/methylation domain-containing protein